jgi:pyridoxal phosphate enzyme (YggS family)
MLILPQNSASDEALPARFGEVRAGLAAAAAAAGKSVDCVTLLAVSKGHSPDAVRALAGMGQRAFGESYLQEALPKMAALADLELEWHFIGRLQANKTRLVAGHFDWVHGLDRLKLAERLAEQRPAQRLPLNVCVQVKPADDPGKAGLAPEAAATLAPQVAALPGLRLRGLMCILPEGLTAAQQQAHFAAVAALQARLVAAGLALDTLSMGMSGDYPVAIAAGATLVRIGTALFGPRATGEVAPTP